MGLRIFYGAYFLYDKKAADLYEYSHTIHYYTEQILLAYIVFGIVFSLYVGSLLGTRDHEWKTWHHKLMYASRFDILISKVIVLLIYSVIISTLLATLGLLLDVLMVGFEAFSLRIMHYILAASFITFFWSSVGMVLGLLIKNFSVSIVLPYTVSLLEPYIYGKINTKMIHYLPLFNQRGLLNNLIESNTGIVIIPPMAYNSFLMSLSVYLLTLVILLVGVVTVRQRIIN